MNYNFDIAQLEIFRLVIELGTVSRGAEQLEVSQPAITKAIQRLEKRLGFALFEHRKGRTSPTHEAVLFYETVKVMLSSAERLMDHARDIKESTVGSLRIISHPLGATAILPPVIEAFKRAHPDVHIRVQTANSPQLYELSRAQAFDIGLAEPPVDTRLLRTTKHSLQCVCALPEGHALADKSIVAVDDLSGYHLVVSAPDRPFYHSIRRLFAERGASWNPGIEVDRGATEAELIRHGVGIGILDSVTAALFMSRGIVVRPLQEEITYDFLVFQPQRQASLIASAFAKTLKENLRNQAGLAFLR
ncbi:LysR family transcriptional regulator, partial [Rhizobiaceae sp. 2RAB30]